MIVLDFPASLQGISLNRFCLGRPMGQVLAFPSPRPGQPAPSAPSPCTTPPRKWSSRPRRSAALPSDASALKSLLEAAVGQGGISRSGLPLLPATPTLFEVLGVNWLEAADAQAVKLALRRLEPFARTAVLLLQQPSFETVLLEPRTQAERRYLKAIVARKWSRVRSSADELGFRNMLQRSIPA